MLPLPWMRAVGSHACCRGFRAPVLDFMPFGGYCPLWIRELPRESLQGMAGLEARDCPVPDTISSEGKSTLAERGELPWLLCCCFPRNMTPTHALEHLPRFARQAMKLLRSGRAFRLVGHFAGYSAIEFCKQRLGQELYEKSSYTCWFRPERPCQAKAANPSPEAHRALEQLRIVKAGSTEETDLFQAIQAYLFRFNEAVPRAPRRVPSVGNSVNSPAPKPSTAPDGPPVAFRSKFGSNRRQVGAIVGACY